MKILHSTEECKAPNTYKIVSIFLKLKTSPQAQNSTRIGEFERSI